MPEHENLERDDLAEAREESEERGSGVAQPKQLDADAILDTIVPPSIDWRGTVRRHPLVSVLGVGLVGYVVGRTKGSAILTGVTAGLSSALMRQLADVFEGDLFEFD
jgi:hypothetical protein